MDLLMRKFWIDGFAVRCQLLRPIRIDLVYHPTNFPLHFGPQPSIRLEALPFPIESIQAITVVLRRALALPSGGEFLYPLPYDERT